MRSVMFALIFLGLSAAANAQQPDIVQRLMSEPLTLFDWGIAQLDRDIARAVHRNFPRSRGPAKPLTGSIYDWRTRRVTVYATLPVPEKQRNEQACLLAFGDIVATMSEGAPKGPDAAGWYLVNAFKPKAHFWGDRFEDIGAKLLAFVRLEVTLTPATGDNFQGNKKRVRCTGRLDAKPDEIEFEQST